MESEIISSMDPYYLGVNPPSGYVLLGPIEAQLYVKQSVAKQNPGPNDPFVRLDDNSSWGVSKDYVVELNDVNFPPQNGSQSSYLKQYRDDYSQFRAPFGRLIPPFTGKLSSVLYFDRVGLNNTLDIEEELLREPGKPKYLNLSFTSRKLYLLLQNNSIQFCCKNNNLGDECGKGPIALNSKNPTCITLGRAICGPGTKPDNFFGTFCQREYCKTDPNSIKPGNCDNEYKNLCNVKVGNEYPYYNKYPDYCACFMGKDFLRPMCSYYIDALGIKRNIKAQNSLRLNINDPNQCNEPCRINPLCRLGAQVPYNMTRGDNPVVLGASFPDECKDIDLCVQDVTVNSTGQIGKLTINQTANCKVVLQKVCAASTFGPCNSLSVNGNKYTYKKKLLEDRDDGQCADPGTEFVCAEFTINPEDVGSISCVKEKLNYKFLNTFPKAFTPEVLTASNHLINEVGILDKFKPSFVDTFKGSNISYNPVSEIVTAEAGCKDCVTGYKGGDCVLVPNNRKWTKYLSLTDILIPPKNGGEVCRINNTLIPTDCPLDRDCSLTFNKKDNYCVDDTYGYTYNINSYPSGNGKTCTDVALSMIGKELVNPTIDIDYNTHKLKASANCNDCIVDFVEDESLPGGKCTLGIDGSFIRKKFAKVIKEATSGGRCPADKLNLALNKATINETCNTNQDCTFKSLSDDCDEVQGIRTLKFIKDTSQSGNGRDCETVGNVLSNEYENVSSVNYLNNILTVNTSCEISSDCKVELKSEECKSGKRKDVYDIIFKPTGRGKTCENTVRELVNDTSLNVRDEGNRVIVEGSCANFEELDRKSDTKKFGVISIVVFILIILFAIFFL